MPTQSKAPKASKSPHAAPKGKASAPKTRGRSKGSKLPLTPALVAPPQEDRPQAAPQAKPGPAEAAAPSALHPEAPVTAEGPHAKPPTSSSTPLPTVASFQRALATAGHYGGLWDGHYGPWTRRAVASFQHSQGLSPTGEPTPATLRALGF